MSAVVSCDGAVAGRGAEPVPIDRVEAALTALQAGRPVLVADDADRENEGDVILAASLATPEWLGWTIRHSSGVICAPMTAERADALALPPMVERNEDPRRTAYTISVDARFGVSTGIGAADRARTLGLLSDLATGPHDLVRPGHIFPLRARSGGVLERRGHTEAAVDLCRLAGLPPIGVIAEAVDDQGELLRLPGLRVLADSIGAPLITVEDLAAYRRRAERAFGAGVPEIMAAARPRPRVERVTETVLPTPHGLFRTIGYRDLATGDVHVALIADPAPAEGALVRVHSECLTGDAFGSRRCDCGPQLDAALARVARDGGVVVYLRGHEGRGIGLLAKLSAYALQDTGLDTVEANTRQGLPVDAREYGAAAAVLSDLGLTGIRLLTNNPAKVEGLAQHGITVRDRLSLEVGVGEFNAGYLRVKRDRLGHHLQLASALPGADA